MSTYLIEINENGNMNRVTLKCINEKTLISRQKYTITQDRLILNGKLYTITEKKKSYSHNLNCFDSIAGTWSVII